MSLLIEMLNDQPQISMRNLSRSLIDTYITRDVLERQSVDAAYLNHAAINLDNFPVLLDAVEDFAAIVNQNPTRFSTVIGQARAPTPIPMARSSARIP